MKQISPSVYNKKYYEVGYSTADIKTLLKKNSFYDRYKEISSLLPLAKGDIIVDYGCGNGDLSYYINKNYGCKVVGIDYSSDAIDVCNKRLNSLGSVDKKKEIKFICSNNDSLPNLSGVRAVFFSDVIEHMYNHEIDIVLKTILKWNNKIAVVVRTDNDIYEKRIRPLLYVVQVIFRIKKLESVIKESAHNKKIEEEQHVNLTNSRKLRKLMKKYGLRQKVVAYPKIKTEKIIGQLGQRHVPHLFLGMIGVLIRLFIFLSPSFYAVYEKE